MGNEETEIRTIMLGTSDVLVSPAAFSIRGRGKAIARIYSLEWIVHDVLSS